MITTIDIAQEKKDKLYILLQPDEERVKELYKELIENGTLLIPEEESNGNK